MIKTLILIFMLFLPITSQGCDGKMNEAQKYAKVFRAAGDGILKPYDKEWKFVAGDAEIQATFIMNFDAEAADKAKEKADMFYAIAKVFESMDKERLK